MLLLFVSGCQTHSVATPCPDPLPLPAAPAQAMVYIPDRSVLPADFTSLPLDQAVLVMLQAHLFDIDTLSRLEAQHAALVDYINGVVK